MGSPIFLPCNCPCCLQRWEQWSCCPPASSCHVFEAGELMLKQEAVSKVHCAGSSVHGRAQALMGTVGEEVPSADLALSILPLCILLLFLLWAGP